MDDWLQNIRHYSSTHPWLPAGGAAVGAIVAITAVWIGVRAARGAGRDRLISTLINIAALMATAVQASGMWKFFGMTMGLPVGFRIFMFSFMEIALLACGLRARANVEDGGDAGIDGVLVWVLAIASGLMSSTEANSPQEALMRVLTSVVVALLWTRDLMAAKQGVRKLAGAGRPAEKIRWRLGVGSIAVKLRLADATDHGLADRDANRRIDAFVMAAHTANTVPEGSRSGERAHRRRAKAHAKLMRHARLHADPTHLMNLLGQAAFAEALELLGIEEPATGTGSGAAGAGHTAASQAADRRTAASTATAASGPATPAGSLRQRTLDGSAAAARGGTAAESAEPRSRRAALSDPDVRAAMGGTAEIRRVLLDENELAAMIAQAEREVAEQRAQRASERAANGTQQTPRANGRRVAREDAGPAAAPPAAATGSTPPPPADGAGRPAPADPPAAPDAEDGFEDDEDGSPELLPGQRILAEREQRMDPSAFVPQQRITAAPRPQTLSVVAENRTTAIAGALKGPKELLFSALDDMHAGGDERLHAGDPRLRNEAALEAANRVGHTGAPRTIQRHAAEWAARLLGPEEA